ncbi:elongator complex protein 3 [Maridesulfovibrio sp. FT414]|uniref:elongator complex protein 3 n=1 Tax=Maridesulfovibrio sp. FT414 TaxID=2979469 RepID=UPI003D800254
MSASIKTFSHPEPDHLRSRIWPVFMPFMGCPVRCVYCSQERQTGTGAKPLGDIYQSLSRDIPEFFNSGRRNPMELAFFGGTFTALPFEWQLRFMGLAAEFKKFGFITKVRFSTRPDCINPEELEQLKATGLDMVELGIQSFAPRTLKRSARNYTPEAAAQACRTVRDCGLSLVVQLLPGLPGSSEGDFQRDIDRTIEMLPDAVRIYPCLTVRGTALEKLYLAGKYRPWDLQQTVQELAPALLRLWKSGIHVIRMGVAHEAGLEDNIVAGPYHPALGQSVRSRALYLYLRTELAALDLHRRHLYVPQRYSGEFWGHKGCLKVSYEAMGISPQNTVFHESSHFVLE